MKSLFTIKEGSAAHWALRLVAALIVVAIMLWIPTKGSNGLVTSATEALTLMSAAMALNLILGYTGQISIGHSAFYGTGAYVTGILVSKYEWSPWLTFPVAFLVAFVVGVLVSFPASRIKGCVSGARHAGAGVGVPQPAAVAQARVAHRWWTRHPQR